MKEDVTVKIVKVVWCAERAETTRKKTKDEVRDGRGQMLEGSAVISSLRSVNSYSINYGDLLQSLVVLSFIPSSILIRIGISSLSLLIFCFRRGFGHILMIPDLVAETQEEETVIPPSHQIKAKTMLSSYQIEAKALYHQ